MTAIRAVVSDFGGVLTSPLLHAFATVQEACGIPAASLGPAMAAVARADGAHPLFELETGRMTEADFLEKLEAALERQLGRRPSLRDFSERYFAALRTNDELLEYFRALRGRGLRLALLTNNVREWEPQWRAKLPEIDEIFDVVVDSAFVGMRKPDPEIYEVTLERLGDGVEPADCVFVDDVDVNCEAARALGMRAVLFQHAEQAIRDVEAALR